MRPLLALLLLAGPAPAQVDYPFHDGFETGVLEGHWSAGGDGATPARVTSDLSPASGAYHLQLGGLDEDATRSPGARGRSSSSQVAGDSPAAAVPSTKVQDRPGS